MVAKISRDGGALRAFVLEYLTSRDAPIAVFMLAVVIAGNIAGVRLALLLNEWNGRFFDALADVDQALIIKELLHFAGLAAAIILVLVTTDYLKSRLILTVRRALTLRLFAKWLTDDGAHYRLRESGHEPDNPDQRLLEDTQALASLSIGLFLSFVESVLTIGTFTAILWSLSMPLVLGTVELPGYMFWACLLYTALGTLITHLIGRPLKALNIEAQHREADLRYKLIEKRRHADAIAGAHGESAERSSLALQLNDLIDLLVKRLRKTRDLSFFTVGLGQVTHMTPMVLGLPGLFAGTYALGGLMQLRSAFVDVARSLSWFIVAYDDLARLAAVATRLEELLQGLMPTESRHTGPDNHAVLTVDMQMTLPDRTRKAALRLDVRPGELVLLTGASGTGKSTVLKTIAGFYDRFEGHIRKPARCLWLPQTAYLMKDTLRANLCYPQKASAVTDRQLDEWLRALNLAHLTTRLNETADWHRVLSGGEAQRLMLVRALVAAPDLLLLDETTSAVDEPTAMALLKELRNRLPHTGILMVTHQDLSSLAQRTLRLASTNGDASSSTF